MLYNIICILLLVLLFIYILSTSKESMIPHKTKKELPYCIVIPTYKPHFKYVEKLINSIDKYCEEYIYIYIIVSENEYNDAKYLTTLSNISVTLLTFKDVAYEILNIEIDENTFLKTCGSYKFQSLKKIISVYYLVEKLKYKYIYVMDSEGLFIKPFLLTKIIEKYIKNKRIFYNSKQRVNYEQSNISKQILNTDIIPGWLLENYFWIYEDVIVKDFFNYLFHNIHNYNDLDNIPKNIFIEIVYYHYIYINNYKYNYQFIDTYDTMKKYFNVDKYLNNELSKLSLLEDIRVILNENTIGPISEYFKDYSIEQTKIFENKYNLEFLKKANIICINSGDFKLNFTIN